MNSIEMLSPVKINTSLPYRRVLCGVLLLVVAVGLSACGNKEKKAGQALVRVDGEEITVLQINDELKRAGVKADQQEVATKQLLEKLIDRQLVIAEATRNKIDRSPGVIQAIERAKAQIIAQAYLESITSKLAKPSMAEIDDYFQKHPEYFAQRKQFDMQQLVFATKDLSDELKSAIDSAKTLDEVASWLDRHNVGYARGQLSRSTTDLPELMVAKLKELKKGELFIVNEGENSMLNSIIDIKDSPVMAKNVAPQIAQYLSSLKAKEAAETEIKHLRSSAKIEYFNASAPPAP
ncbi:MAG: EpsD family peptidyl-prolyl cis-trans isomerase [Pseudomonadota bacterium]